VAEALGPFVAPAGPWLVTLTWEHFNRADGDNVQGALKSVRDAVAAWLGCDDGDERAATWAYRQEVRRELVTVTTSRGPVRRAVNRVRVQVAARADGA
jgi:hypothetical protein